MAKSFRPSSRESKILSKIESSKEYARRKAITAIQDFIEPLSNAIAMKLVESKLVETGNKNGLQEQINNCLDKLSHADEFDVDYQIAPFRHLVGNPHTVSLYLTAFVIEQLINHRDIIDIFGSDEDIYSCINFQVIKFLPA
jgi:peptide subunit release factor 1 (eRF1)